MAKAPDFNPQYVAVVFCARCHSNRVDVSEWRDGETARLRCAACGHEAEVVGFTLGRALGIKVAPILGEAVQDMALPELAALVMAKAGAERAS